MCIKNVDQFINKPNDAKKNGNIKLLISPLSKPSPIRFKHNKKLVKNHEFHKSQEKLLLGINNNDSMSLHSNSKIDLSKSFVHGKTLQLKQSNYMHFPSPVNLLLKIKKKLLLNYKNYLEIKCN